MIVYKCEHYTDLEMDHVSCSTKLVYVASWERQEEAAVPYQLVKHAGTAWNVLTSATLLSILISRKTWPRTLYKSINTTQ